MKYLLTLLTAVLCVATFSSTSLAQDAAPAEGKEKGMRVQIMRMQKLLEPLTLSEEQGTAFEKASEKFAAELKEIKEKGLTKELFQARTEKMKAGKAEGLKKKALKAHGLEGLSEEEVQLFTSFENSTTEFQKTVAKMLTSEQLAELPEKAQKRMNSVMKEQKGKGKKGGKGKGKGKKKKKAKAEGEEDQAAQE